MKIPLFILFILLSSELFALKVEGIIILHDGDSVSVTISGFKNNLISPYSRIKSDDRKFSLQEIDQIHLPVQELSFDVIDVQVFEDHAWVIATRISDEVYLGLINYRPCTCNNSYRVSNAYILLNQEIPGVIIKHHLKDRVIKKRGVYFGLSPDLEEKLKGVNYRFSSIPEILAQ